MDVLAHDGFDDVLLPGPPPRRPEGPVRLLLLAVVWIVAASAAAFAWAFLIGVVVGLHNGMRVGHAHPWRVPDLFSVLLMLLVSDLVLVFAGWGRGSVVGGGDVRAGLAIGPIRRPGLLLVFATLGQAAALGWAVSLYALLKPSGHGVITTLLTGSASAGGVVQTVTLLCAVVLSPLWEEFFFRGWLWTGLRRRWATLPVMLTTAVLWLLLHMADGLLRPLYLLPMAVLLCLAREYCGGVRASLTLHVLNNLIAMALLLFAVPHVHT